MRPIAGLGEAPLDPVQRLEWCVKGIREITKASHIISSLQEVNATAGEFGSAPQTLIVTVDGQGRVTAIQEVSIAIAHGQVSGLGSLALLNQVPDASIGATQLGDNAVGTAELGDNVVTNVEAADMAQATIKGRASGAGTGDPTDLTGTQAVAILPDASDTQRGPIEHATLAELYAATTGNLALTAAHLETAANFVTLTFGTPTALNWDDGINRVLTMTANATLSNPTNGQPGTWRHIFIDGNSGTLRTLTLDTQYNGPNLTDGTDITSSKRYLLSIYCVTTSFFMAVLTPSTA